ncbi:MAG: PD-(D/E)XK motif protein [Bacteroidetes bacterium]|nr:PD-(D/E)XK motif protein [Bacteroidota bacterium]
MKNLSVVWKELEDKIKDGRTFGIIRKDRYSKLGFSVGMDLSDKTKLVMLAINDPALIQNDQLPKWEGTKIEKRKITDEKYALVVKLLNEDAVDIFNSLINDIHNRIKGSKDKDEALTLFTDTLFMWYEFFKKFGVKILSQESQRGIFGELYFIKNHLLPVIDPISTLNYWYGHEGSSQDFSFPNGNVEVKTTIRKEHKKVMISSEKQLDNTGLPNLYLYCITLNLDPNNGESLSDIVTTLREYLIKFPNAVNIFNTYLMNTGYLDEHAEYYNKYKYIFKKEYLFKVAEGFPRIIDPPDGVGSLKYSLVLSACLNNATEISEAIRSLTYNVN